MSRQSLHQWMFSTLDIIKKRYMSTHGQTRVVGIGELLHRTNHDIVVFCTAEELVLPSLRRLAHRMRRLVPPDKSMFFSGPGHYQPVAEAYAQKHGLQTISDFADPTMTEMATDAGPDVLHEYWRRMSQAYVRATRGPAYVLLPGDPAQGTSWFQGTIWDQVEYPFLQKIPVVTHIFRINPSMTPAQGLNIKTDLYI